MNFEKKKFVRSQFYKAIDRAKSKTKFDIEMIGQMLLSIVDFYIDGIFQYYFFTQNQSYQNIDIFNVFH